MSAPLKNANLAGQAASAARRGIALPVLVAAGRATAADEPPLAVIDQKALAEPWTVAEFGFELEGERVPGIVVKLPGERW